MLLEDAMMAYRIVRSPERRVFYIDVGQIPPNEVEQYMQKVMTQMKRNSIVDESTGRVDLRYNPLSIEEDFYIPTRGGTSSRVEPLPGGAFTGDIDDVKYLRDKLFSALKIPASYLSRGEGADEDKTTLAQKDIRFARTIQRLQRSVVSELEKIGIVHLYTLGFRGDDLINFKLSLNNPSKIAELQELEHWDKKFSVAGAATFYDRKFDAQLIAVAEAVQEEAAGLGGAFGGDDLGGEELGGDDLGGEELGGDELGGDELGGEPGEEEDILLAAPPEEGGAPGRREDEPSSINKGKAYYPVKRVRDRRKHGGRARHFKSQAGGYVDPRTIYPGLKGNGGLSSLYNGVSENRETNYSEADLLEERKILNMSSDVIRLISELENMESDIK